MIQAPSILQQLSPSKDQRPGIVARGTDIAMVAGAGSGKTRTLVARYLSLLEDGLSMRRMLAVTFTEKAALEMRSRLRQEIARYLERDDLSDEQRLVWQAHADASSAARIGTIHALCAEMLRTHPAQACIDPKFDVLDDAAREAIYAQVGRDALAWAISQPEMIELIQAVSSSKAEELIRIALIERLDLVEAFEVIGDDPWPVWSDAICQWVCAMLDDPVIADDLACLRELGQTGAIDAAFGRGDKLAEPMRRALAVWDKMEEAAQESDWSELVSLLPSFRKAVGGNYGSSKNWPQPNPKPIVVRIRNWYDGTGITTVLKGTVNLALDVRAAQLMPALHQLLIYAWERYAALKDAANLLDYDDMEQMALAILSNPENSDVLSYWRQQAQAILVDEFQDTNHRQRDLLSLLNGVNPELLRETSAATSGHLFIVGDAKQSIYRFRGADVSVFRRERQEIAQRGGERFSLDTSYRGHHALVEAINSIMSRIMSDEDDPRRPYAEPFAPLEAYRQEQASGLVGPFVECHLGLGAKTNGALDASARAVADRLVELVEGSSIRIGEGDEARPLAYGDVAVLCRASSAFATYENALDQAGIPYVTVSGRGFYQRPEIRDLLNLLSAVWDAGDDLALSGALRSPAFCVSDYGLYQLCDLRREMLDVLRDDDKGVELTLWDMLTPDDHLPAALAEVMLEEDQDRLRRAIDLLATWRQQAGRTTVADLIKRILDDTHYEAILRAAGQARAQRNVAKLLSDAHQSGLVSVGDFIEFAHMLHEKSVRQGEARAANQGAVQIMTIHQSKGLEFPVVVVGDMASSGSSRAELLTIDREWGPLLNLKDDDRAASLMSRLFKQKEDDQEDEESRRQLYVALTRARELLLFSGCIKVTTKGNLQKGAGWLGWLMGEDILALTGQPAPFDPEGIESARDMRLVGETPIACSYYPLQHMATHRASLREDEVLETLAESRFPLVAPLSCSERSDDRAEPRHSALTGLTEPSRRLLGTLAGNVIHLSLANNLLSGHQIERLARNQAHRYLMGDTEAAWIATRAQTLLDRFLTEPFYQQMTEAKRLLHEVPYSVPVGDKMDSGIIDALFLDQQGQWHVVEFKSDQVPGHVSLSAFIGGSDYEHQVYRYRRAVRELLHVRPIAHLVLLDFHGQLNIAQLM